MTTVKEEKEMDTITQRQDAVVRACFDWCANWLDEHGYHEAAEQFDKEVLGG